MGRVWMLAGAIVAALVVMFLLQDLAGSGTLLTMAGCVIAGAAAAYLPGGAFLSRGLWLFVGVIVGALGFVLGASALPDTNLGLLLGAVIPTLILATLTMWTKRQSSFLAGMLGNGAMAGVYAHVFDADPQSINVSAPIAMGQTILPLGVGYLAAVVVVLFVATDDAANAAADQVEPPPSDQPDDQEAEPGVTDETVVETPPDDVPASERRDEELEGAR